MFTPQNMPLNMINPQMMMYQPQPAPFPRNQENCLYIGNLHPDLSEDVLFGEFCRFGNITGCKIMWNAYTRESRCFGFVTFQNKQDAEKAQSTMNGIEFYKRELRVYLKKNLKSLNPDANFIIKDLDRSVTTKMLTEECKKYGDVISCFVRKEEINGRLESLGYGYVQFSDGADCREFLEQMNGKEINGKKIKVERFVSAKLRERPQSKNIYIKQFPASWEKEQIEKFIDESFAQFGNINLKGVYRDPKLERFYAFVAFDETSSATEAIAKMNKHAFSETESLYVGQAQSKSSRRAMLFSERMNIKHQTNLYIRSLRADVTKEELLNAVSKYGKITSICLKEWKNTNRAKAEGEAPVPEQSKPLQFGFFNFETNEQALNCYHNYKKDPEIRKLAEVESENINFVFFAQPKQIREQYLRVTKRNNTAYSNIRFGGVPMYPNKPFKNYKQPGNKNQKRMQGPYPMGAFIQGMPQMPVPGMPPMGMVPPMHLGVGGMQMPVNPLTSAISVPGMKEVPKATNSPFSPNIHTKDNKEIAKELRQHKAAFMEWKSEDQKNFLGNIMYLRVKKFKQDENLLPKITGMLIDLEVLDYDEIVEIIENDESLQERIEEAIDVITETPSE